MWAKTSILSHLFATIFAKELGSARVYLFSFHLWQEEQEEEEQDEQDEVEDLLSLFFLGEALESFA